MKKLFIIAILAMIFFSFEPQTTSADGNIPIGGRNCTIEPLPEDCQPDDGSGKSSSQETFENDSTDEDKTFIENLLDYLGTFFSNP